jgi:AcrB/AcrD/AcrF family
MGVIPLVIASGAGSEMREAIGIAVFAGMLGVTTFGLFLTPVFFVTIETWLERRKQHLSYQGSSSGEVPRGEVPPGEVPPGA